MVRRYWDIFYVSRRIYHIIYCKSVDAIVQCGSNPKLWSLKERRSTVDILFWKGATVVFTPVAWGFVLLSPMPSPFLSSGKAYQGRIGLAWDAIKILEKLEFERFKFVHRVKRHRDRYCWDFGPEAEADDSRSRPENLIFAGRPCGSWRARSYILSRECNLKINCKEI